jgi:uncharacterized iron-regulated protein
MGNRYSDIVSVLEKYDSSTQNTVDDIRRDMKALSHEVRGNNKWIIGISVSTIIGIAAMVIKVMMTK